MLNRDEYLAAWSRWHGGADTSSPLVRGWLTIAHTLARPL
ncbi:MAG: CDP-alcohol phosphatidyltransferase, partial [Blastococcus sp.]|nr:CDP-alcohol phosphatidyltransferase [Blastococcus sp.]